MTVRLWDTSTGAALHTLEADRDRMDHSVEDVIFSLDSKMVVSAINGSTGGTVQFRDAAMGAALQTIEIHTAMAEAMAFSSDRKIVASGFEDGTVHFLDVATGAVLQTLEVISELVETMAFSPYSGAA
jgi:WD40 repeat protein